MYASIDLLTKILLTGHLSNVYSLHLYSTLIPLILMLNICIHRMKHFIHVICEWKLETISAAHNISLVLALPRNMSIGSEHETFGLVYKYAAVKLYIFFLEFCLWYFSDANAMSRGEWHPCLICCSFNLRIEEGRHKYWIYTFMPLYTSKGRIHLKQLKLTVDCNSTALLLRLFICFPL